MINSEAMTPLDRLNPLVGLVVIAIIATAVIVSFQPSTVIMVLLAEIPLLVAARLSARRWLARAVPLLLILGGIMISNLLFTDIRSGTELLSLGPLAVTSGGAIAAFWVALRLVALALPGMIFFARLDPTDLSDALITHWRAKPRIAVGSLAALRMTPLVLADLRQSYAARRTRGVISLNPVVALPTVFGTLSAVLVAAIRRATRLSGAMDARGFDSGVERTLARRSVWRRHDTAVIGGYLLVALVAVAIPILG